MSRTIKAIGRHMIPRSRIQPAPNGERKLVAEWQRGPEVSGHAQGKLRLTFVPSQSQAVATC